MSRLEGPGYLNAAEGGRTTFLLPEDHALLSFPSTQISEGLGAGPLLGRGSTEDRPSDKSIRALAPKSDCLDDWWMPNAPEPLFSYL